jgi:hypothetical protein
MSAPSNVAAGEGCPPSRGTVPLRWYLRRLRLMSGAEVGQRAAQALLLQYLKLERTWRFRPAGASDWQRFAFCRAHGPQLPELAVAFDPAPEERARLLAGDWGALGLPWRWGANDTVWHLAPDSGRLWPRRFFGSIAYRSGNPHGDARLVWEPSRLQGLVDLALLARSDSRDLPAAAARIEAILASWVRGNPYLRGVHYVSAMECALRMIAACHALDMVRAQLRGPRTWADFVWLLESHAALIARRLSQHSSAGNHSIAEATGLLYAGLLLAEDRSADRWRELGLATLQQEAARQVLADGGGIEQAPWYHLFVLDLLGLADALLRHHGRTVPPAISAALERGRAFIAALAGSPSELPQLGDADGGFALTKHLRISFSANCSAAPREALRFPDAGYTVLRPAAAPQLRILIDHGPLGMLPACGHGHADALSVTVRLGETDLLIDPGTFAYNLGDSWRRYFRGTRAHNTVTVDGGDQARQEGAFLWSSPYRTEVFGSEKRGLLMRHDGYGRIGVTHWRGVSVRGGGLLVWDLLEGTGVHEFELNWHLGMEPLTIAAERGEIVLRPGYRLLVRGGRCAVHRAERDPPTGWASPAYGQRLSIPTLRVSCRSRAPHEFVTVLAAEFPDEHLSAALEELRALRASILRTASAAAAPRK